MKITEDRTSTVLQAVLRNPDATLDPRWAALAEGTLGEAEREALRVVAEQDAETRALWELYRPFSMEEDERLVDGVRRKLREDRARRRRATVLRLSAAAIALAAIMSTIYFALR